MLLALDAFACNERHNNSAGHTPRVKRLNILSNFYITGQPHHSSFLVPYTVSKF